VKSWERLSLRVDLALEVPVTGTGTGDYVQSITTAAGYTRRGHRH